MRSRVIGILSTLAGVLALALAGGASVRGF
jgi:hypothetical protein